MMNTTTYIQLFDTTDKMHATLVMAVARRAVSVLSQPFPFSLPSPLATGPAKLRASRRRVHERERDADAEDEHQAARGHQALPRHPSAPLRRPANPACPGRVKCVDIMQLLRDLPYRSPM